MGQVIVVSPRGNPKETSETVCSFKPIGLEEVTHCQSLQPARQSSQANRELGFFSTQCVSSNQKCFLRVKKTLFLKTMKNNKNNRVFCQNRNQGSKALKTGSRHMGAHFGYRSHFGSRYHTRADAVTQAFCPLFDSQLCFFLFSCEFFVL